MMRRNADLHSKLDAQIAAHRAQHDADPARLSLSHDEIDEWRNQFDIAIQVASLAYRDIPIVEAAP